MSGRGALFGVELVEAFFFGCQNHSDMFEATLELLAPVEFNQGFEKTLIELNGRQQLERGLEHIAMILAAEKKGLDELNAKQGTAPTHRISRLLITVNRGSERSYRVCER